MSDVDDLPAYERTQSQAEPPPEDDGSTTWRTTGLALLVAVGIGLAVWFFGASDDDAGDMLVQLAETAAGFQPERATTVPDDARAFVYDALGWSVPPPDLPSLALVGVGLPTVGAVRPTPSASPSEVQVPAFRYEGGSGERAVVFAYDYILLDHVGGAFDLPEGTYAGLSEPTPVDSRVVDGAFVVTWRRRSMIFSAVTESEAIADRIRQAVSA